MRLVAIALGQTELAACIAGDSRHDGRVTVSEIIAAVNTALGGVSLPEEVR